ncbi:solute carrier family 35 member E2A-like isoform X3 [Tachypleus tridentatus]|uniref:solute carrier family 35 member E2A-like isoform X3 n=1 Tax=Tachypleus tridentatus TaxID=6853 RepID=UPI003FD1E10B
MEGNEVSVRSRTTVDVPTTCRMKNIENSFGFPGKDDQLSTVNRHIDDSLLNLQGISDNNTNKEVEMHDIISFPSPVGENHAQDKNVIGFHSNSRLDGLSNVRAIVLLILWYFFSFTTLFLNKYILTYQKGDATALGSTQLIMCMLCGYFQMKFPFGFEKKVHREKKPVNFYRHMVIVGSLSMQNVYSKILLSNEKHNNSPSELQFYTSITSLAIQVPACLLLIDFQLFYSNLNKNLIIAYLLDGVSFHCQSITEYTLLGYISPVTHSVANTAKRALLIWLSVLTFGNPVTPLSAVGTVVVILGVLLYNKARNWSIKTKSSTLVSQKPSVHSA